LLFCWCCCCCCCCCCCSAGVAVAVVVVVVVVVLLLLFCCCCCCCCCPCRFYNFQTSGVEIEGDPQSGVDVMLPWETCVRCCSAGFTNSRGPHSAARMSQAHTHTHKHTRTHTRTHTHTHTQSELPAAPFTNSRDQQCSANKHTPAHIHAHTHTHTHTRTKQNAERQRWCEPSPPVETVSYLQPRQRRTGASPRLTFVGISFLRHPEAATTHWIACVRARACVRACVRGTGAAVLPAGIAMMRTCNTTCSQMQLPEQVPRGNHLRAHV
jgi:hypothetical protein